MVLKAFFISTICHLLITISALGQVDKRDLYGTWSINNRDSLYYKSDTILLTQDANYMRVSNTCHLLEWRINRSQIDVFEIYTCTEPGRETSSKNQDYIKLKNKDKQQFIEIRRNGKTLETFQILNLREQEVDRYPWNTKSLELKRI